VTCPHCGGQTLIGAFCNSCGKSLDATRPETPAEGAAVPDTPPLDAATPVPAAAAPSSGSMSSQTKLIVAALIIAVAILGGVLIYSNSSASAPQTPIQKVEAAVKSGSASDFNLPGYNVYCENEGVMELAGAQQTIYGCSADTDPNKTDKYPTGCYTVTQNGDVLDVTSKVIDLSSLGDDFPCSDVTNDLRP
jgi:hypothetical protein